MLVCRFVGQEEKPGKSAPVHPYRQARLTQPARPGQPARRHALGGMIAGPAGWSWSTLAAEQPVALVNRVPRSRVTRGEGLDRECSADKHASFRNRAYLAGGQRLDEHVAQGRGLHRADLSGPEIAHELVIALSTLRTHTKRIYGKLNVNSRRAAVSRAIELGLL